MTATFRQFEVGQTYTCRSIGDADCIYSVTVASRTAATITTSEGKKLGIVKGLSKFNSAECVRPMGNYSMCPVIRAK